MNKVILIKLMIQMCINGGKRVNIGETLNERNRQYFFRVDQNERENFIYE